MTGRMFTSENRSIATVETALTGPGEVPSDSPHRVSPKSTGPRLLFVDDSRTLLSLYKSVFESLGFEVFATSSSEEALNPALLATTDVAILDYEMPEVDGGQLAYLIKERHPMLPVIIYSGAVSIPQSANNCVDAFCLKAAPREELRTTIERLLPRPSKSEGSEYLPLEA